MPKERDASQPPPKSNVYQVYSGYTGIDNGCTNATILLPPDFNYNASNTLAIPSVFQAVAQPVNVNVRNDDFVLTASLAPGVNPPAASVVLTNANRWKCAPAARKALQDNFVDFYTQLEGVEIQQKALIPGGTDVIMQRIASALPILFNESLLFHYGLNSGLITNTTPYVDLVAGMRLRVEFEASQFIDPTSALNGFVSSGQFFFDLGHTVDASAANRLSFDAFLNGIAAPTISTQSSPTVAAGLIDLQASGMARRHYRLFYPAQLTTAPGSQSMANNVTLIGADTLSDLAKATTAYQASYTCGTAAAGNAAIQCLIFRGRTTVVPEIGIFVNQRLTYVPLGTTVRNVFDRMIASNYRTWGNNAPIQMRRWWTSNDASDVRLMAINFSVNPAVPDATAFELPVLRGDSFNVQF